jgi:hypothetical protein
VDWLQWFNTNSGAMTGMAAVAGVIVAAVYAYFTILLWRATKTQAKITQLMFEASHRPYLSVTVRQLIPFLEAQREHLDSRVVIENHGSVPAAITAWDIQSSLMIDRGPEQPIKLTEPITTPSGGCLAPHTLMTIKMHFVGNDLPQTQPQPRSIVPRVHGRLEYRGIGSQVYRTDFDATEEERGTIIEEYTMM